MALVDFHRLCVQQESAAELLDFGDWQRVLFSKAATEELVTGTRNELDLTDELRRMAAQLGPGDVLQYGWPTIVLQDPRGTLKCAPLLVLELGRFNDGDVTVAPAEAAALNAALLGGFGLDPADVEELAAALSDPLPVAAPAALKALLESVMTALGFPCGDLDPTKLNSALPQQVGVHNVAMFIATSSSMMTRTLINELRELRTRTDWTTTAARFLVPSSKNASPPPLAAPPNVPLASPWPLNDAQEQALMHLRDQDLTVITGPPGTGKSQVVVAAVANAWLTNRAVLLASTNNAAVDVAVARATKEHPGLLVRTGNKTHRDNLPAVIHHVLEVAKSFTGSTAQIQKALSRTARKRTEYLNMLAATSKVESELTQALHAAEDAAQAIWRNASPPTPIDAKQACHRARRLRTAWFFARWRRRRFLRSLCAPLTLSMDQILEWAAPRARFEQLHPELLDTYSKLGDIPATLRSLEDVWGAASHEAVRAAASGHITSKHASLSLLGGAPRAGHAFATAVEHSMSCARGWACTALSMAQNFPLKPGLFDQVIIDEASQCSVAAALPLAYRAKRLAVVGDPNQLTPIVRLHPKQADRLAKQVSAARGSLKQLGQDYIEGSTFLAFRHVVGTSKVILLDEHYRCHPIIARWFNRTFYGDSLTILTDISAMPSEKRGMAWLDVNGKAERGPTGSWVNRAEADEVIRLAQTLIGSGRTVGVVSPFSAQAGLIREMASRQFGSTALEAADFTSGTAHRLQGDERDVVIFTPVVAPGLGQGAARWIENTRNLLNVAASRARQHLIIVGHPSEAASLQIPTLVALRAAALATDGDGGTSWGTASRAEDRLLDAMYAADLEPLLKPVTQGYELDFAIIKRSLKLDIEVDGAQHLDARGRQRRRDVARDRVLAAEGWTVFRTPDWRCIHEPERVAEEIRQLVSHK